MAGPSLSHILDPRPDSESGHRRMYSPPTSYGNHQHSLSSTQSPPQYQPRDISRGSAAADPLPSVSGNTRNISTPPVSLPPPTSTNSTLQVRPALASATLSGSLLRSAGVVAENRSDSLNHSHSQQPTHGQQHLESGVGAASSAASPSSPGLASATSTTTPNSQPQSHSQSNHRGSNLYACRDCGRSYSRPEHLVRHVQTHTLGRRFVCEICQKSFARKDLLRRHVANHDNDSPKKRRRTTTSPGAGRVSHACRSCAVARVKCDDTKPCRRCVNRKLECVSTEAPSTAAMHLMHFSANAHSSVTSSDDKKGHLSNEESKDKHARANSFTTSRESQSPGSFGHQQALGQPRSLPAPQSMHERAPQHQQQQHHNYHNHSRASSAIGFSSSYPKPSSYEPSQLPTPETFAEQVHTGAADYPPPPTEWEPATSAMDPNRLPFSDFLRDVVKENSPASARTTPIQGLTVLDFCDQDNLQLNDDDFGLLDHWNIDGNHGLAYGGGRSALGAHGRDSPADVAQVRQDLVNIWTNSSWSPDTRHQDSSNKERRDGGSENSNTDINDKVERVTTERLEHSARDRVLGIVFSRPGPNSRRVASSFPSVEVMDILVQNFLVSLAQQASEWIHFPTFRLNAQSPEWIAVAAASGAALSPIPTLRKFGFVLQDAARATLPTQFEDATTIRDLALVQALLLTQEIGLWSGNRRRMELAQGHLAVPVTLLRYHNKFQRTSYSVIDVEPSDEGAELEQKWRRWVDRERWKRLVFHCFLRDAQCSMTTFTNQAMSYAELTLPLPEVKELWLARSATEWKHESLQRRSGQDRITPCIGDLLRDIQLLPQNSQLLDVQFSVSIYLHGFWALVLEYRKLSAVHGSSTSSTGSSQNLLLRSRHQELVRELQGFHLMAQDWPDMTSQEHMLLNLLIMNLHVSLDDLQTFAGKEGEDQARRIYPVLQQWALGSEARSAIWCAGQILRYAKVFPSGCLKDFHAVAVHHAALALWTYGVVTRADQGPSALPSKHRPELVYLDDPENASTQRFVRLGQGWPAIRGPMLQDSVSESELDDSRNCMRIAQEVLRYNFKDAEGLPPMVDNLCTLIKELGDAAWAANLGSS